MSGWSLCLWVVYRLCFGFSVVSLLVGVGSVRGYPVCHWFLGPFSIAHLLSQMLGGIQYPLTCVAARASGVPCFGITIVPCSCLTLFMLGTEMRRCLGGSFPGVSVMASSLATSMEMRFLVVSVVGRTAMGKILGSHLRSCSGP